MIPFQTHTWLGAMRHQKSPAGRAALAAVAAFELLNAGALAADELLYSFGEMQVKQPLFIIGPPRCGTTRLYRLLARDPQFTGFRFWQLLAPAITAQTAARGLARLDGRLGGPLRAALRAREERALTPFDHQHRLRLDEPEEDEALFMHAFASEILAVALPYPDVLMEYRAFDALPAPRRTALLRYYKRCVQRHLWLEGPERTFLSKNPLFCHKVASIRQTFPDGRFLLILRHPLEALASMLSLIESMRGVVNRQSTADQALMLAFVADCYGNALEALDRLPEPARLTVRYRDLVASPRRLAERVYGHFGLPAIPAAIFAEEEEKARAYRSTHRYDLADFGLDPGQVERALRARLGERFGRVWSL